MLGWPRAGADMRTSCALADCIWADNTDFCTVLEQAAVPLDKKWPLIILYLRGIKENAALSERQKMELQRLLLGILQEKNFSERALEETERNIHAIITADHAEKIREIIKEAAGMAQEVHNMVGQRCEDVACIVSAVDSDLAKGMDPGAVLVGLHNSLKDVMAKMAEDVDSLKALSWQDALTGLANRRSFDVYLQKAIAAWEEHQPPISLIMIDIDHFKKVNDTFGHRAGDQVLQTLGGLLSKTIQPLAADGESALVARYGGEEFAVVLCGELASRALTLAEVIRKAASKITITLPGTECGGPPEKDTLTISLGVSAMWPGWQVGGDMQGRLVDAADRALYRAKSSGRNCTVQFLPDSDEPYKLLSPQ